LHALEGKPVQSSVENILKQQLVKYCYEKFTMWALLLHWYCSKQFLLTLAVVLILCGST